MIIVIFLCIICTFNMEDIFMLLQIKAEVAGCLDFLNHVYGSFGFSFNLQLSTRPEKYLGEIEMWDTAEKVSCRFTFCKCRAFHILFSGLTTFLLSIFLQKVYTNILMCTHLATLTSNLYYVKCLIGDLLYKIIPISGMKKFHFSSNFCFLQLIRLFVMSKNAKLLLNRISARLIIYSQKKYTDL